MEAFSEGAAVAVVVSLGAVGVLHVSWALGGVWPGHDRLSLARTVLSAPLGDRMPPASACLAVAALLGVGAALVIAAVWSPTLLWRLGAWALAAVLLLRGVLGYLHPALRGEGGRGAGEPGADVARPFDRLNRLVYSPLCLGLGLLTGAALLGSSGTG